MDADAPGISPFQLVFGRRPRLSGKDITFPRKVVPSPNVKGDKKHIVSSLCNRLASFRLTALERQLHRKQKMRERHDRDRHLRPNVKPKRGDLVYLHTQSATPKLKYQWSAPVWLVIKTSLANCCIKSLVSATGRKRQPADTKTANYKKVQVAGPLTVDFWIGAVVRRRFTAGWFLGTVVDICTDEGKTYYKVDYEDFDQEELDTGELWDTVIYHPKLDTDHYQHTQLPQVKEVVLFTSERRPRLGEVIVIDPAGRCPITIVLLKPDSKASSLVTARYIRGQEDGQDTSMRLLPTQLKADSLKLKEDGSLTADSQRTMAKLLKPTKRTAPRREKTRKNPSSGSKNNDTRKKPLTQTTRARRATARPRITQTRYNLHTR